MKRGQNPCDLSLGEETSLAINLDFKASSNEAEYEPLLLGLRAMWNMEATREILYLDSQLAIQQSNGRF